MTEPRLFRGALAAISVEAWWRWPDGWVVTVSARYDGEDWDSGSRTTYAGLTTSEALDAIEGTLSTLSG